MNCDHPLPRFIDVEASSLAPSSFPIEVGWSDDNGNINSYLINPDCVRAWTDWDFDAEALHGISRAQCVLNGFHPEFVCRRLSHSIKPGEIIYADGGDFDQDWIDGLYAVCSSMPFSKFRVVHSNEVMLPLLTTVFGDDDRRVMRAFEKLKRLARQKVSHRHRAAVDVLYLITLYKQCHELLRRKTR